MNTQKILGKLGAALGAVVLAGSISVAAAEDLALEFPGVVEPISAVFVSPQVDGVVRRVLVQGGETVSVGDPLFEMDDASFVIDVDAARARQAETAARLNLAEDAAQRQAALFARGTGSRVGAAEAEAALAIARATLERTQADLARAELDLARTRIAAPIDGRIGRPRVSPGAFVEAEAGSVLAEIIREDTVLVAYAVPFEARQRFLAATGAEDTAAMFERLSLSLVLPGNVSYPHRGTPSFESVRIDPDTGALTVWGQFANPDGVLVAGLGVTVISTLATDQTPDGAAQ